MTGHNRHQAGEIAMLIPANPGYSLPWRWISAAALIFVMAVLASL
jgi:hypothetical protein